MTPRLEKQSWVFHINEVRRKRTELKPTITAVRDRLLNSTTIFFFSTYAELFIFIYIYFQ